MLRYLFRRLLYSILTLWGVATAVFLLFIVLPDCRVAQTTRQPSNLAAAEAGSKTPRPSRALWIRYGLYLNDLSPIGVTSSRKASLAPSGFHLTSIDDSSYLSLKAPFLGRSGTTQRPVAEVLGAALPGTIMLAFAALLFAAFVGTGLGILAALKTNTFWDAGTIAAFVGGISMPSFFAALVLAYIFGYLLNIHAGMESLDKLGAVSHLASRNLILPALALGIRPMAIIAQLTRSAMLHVLGQDYIRAAYAKGLGKTHVVVKHAMPNALNAVVAAASGWLAELLAGAFFVEYIFGWKGIGRVTVDALDKSDLPLVMGAALQVALIFIVVKLLADMLRGLLDPRVRL